MRSRVPPRSFESGRPVAARIEIPDRHLDAGLGHVVAADAPQRRIHLARMLEALPDHQRRDEAGDDVPHRFGGLAAVVGIGFGDRLAPAFVRSVAPSTRTSTKVRSYERPKLVSKKCTSGRRQRNSSIFSIFTSYKLYSAAEWPFTISPSKARSGSARRGWPNGWPPARSHDHSRRHREPVPRRLLRRSARRGAAGSAVLPAQPPSPADRQAPGGSVPADDDLRLRVRQGQDLRVPESRRQRAVHLSAAVRSAGARRAAARSGGLSAGADRAADGAAAQRGADGIPSATCRCPTKNTCAS